MSGLFSTFKTDNNAEQAGVWVEYGDLRVRIARAGGRNLKFGKLMEAALKPYRRALQTDTMDEKVADKIMKECYVDGIITGCEALVNGQWTTGMIPSESGEPVQATKENWVALFNALPDFWLDLVQQSQNVSLFRTETLKADAGN